MAKRGIDISEHQKDINLAALKDQIDFVIIRVGYGVSGTIEYRTPIPGLDRLWPWLDDRLRFAAFYDWGYIGENGNLYNYPQRFLHSVGFGGYLSLTQWLTAQVGVGFPLQRKFDENASRLYFSINSEIDKIFCRNVEKL